MSLLEPSSITAEKSLFQIWRLARRVPRTKTNWYLKWISACLIGVYLFFSRQSPHEIAEMFRGWANTGLAFAATILGFLVAGFTIFATLSKPSLLAAMAEHEHDESGLSYLKYNFAVFFETFCSYLGFSALSILILVFGPVNGAATQFATALPSGKMQEMAIWFLPRACALIVGVWLICLFLELKSFIFNIYHVVMSSIRWTVEFPDAEDVSCRYAPPVDEKAHQTSSATTPDT